MFWAGVVVPFGVEYPPPAIGETDGVPLDAPTPAAGDDAVVR
jgi:hypothetical protein